MSTPGLQATGGSFPLDTSASQSRTLLRGMRSRTVGPTPPFATASGLFPEASIGYSVTGHSKLWWRERPSESEAGNHWCQGNLGRTEGPRVGAGAVCHMTPSATVPQRGGGHTTYPVGVIPHSNPMLCARHPEAQRLRSSPKDSCLGWLCSVCFCVMGSV